jgi:ketosteroid isomerase-like protein
MTRPRPTTRPDGARRVPAPEWTEAERQAAQALTSGASEPDSIETDTFRATRHYVAGTPQVAIVRYPSPERKDEPWDPPY